MVNAKLISLKCQLATSGQSYIMSEGFSQEKQCLGGRENPKRWRKSLWQQLYHNFMVPAHVTRDFGLSLVSGNYFVTTDFDVDMIHFFAFQTRTALLVAIFATALSTSEALTKVRPIFVAERMSMNVKGELAHNLSLQHISPSLPPSCNPAGPRGPRVKYLC